MNNKILYLTVIILAGAGISLAQAAGIKGVVKYEGAVPDFPTIKMDADPVCLALHGSPVYPQTLALGEGNAMANVFVHVTGGLPNKKYAPPEEPVILDQKGCMYDPHVLGVMAGQPLKVLNPDGTLHNVHGIPKINKEFNMAMPKFRKEITLNFDKPEFMFPLKCDVHPWMGAWVAVMEHPYFSTTKEDGLYLIDGLEPGEYEIEAWHERLGTQKMKVALSQGEIKEVNFTFTRP